MQISRTLPPEVVHQFTICYPYNMQFILAHELGHLLGIKGEYTRENNTDKLMRVKSEVYD